MSLVRNLFVIAAVSATSMSSVFCADTADEVAESNEISTLTITDSYTYQDNYYLVLSNGSNLLLQKVIVKKATGWFDNDKYGNPAAHWLIDDKIQVIRGKGLKFPIQLINLETQEEASGSYVNPEMQELENIHKEYKALSKENKKLRTQLDKINKKITVPKKSPTKAQ